MVRLMVAAGLVAVASLAIAGPTHAQASQLLPGVTYETGVQFTAHGPVSIHVVRGPRPVGLYRLRPVLSNEAVVQRETLSSMQRRLSSQATAVGVNGDFFSRSDGRPSGILLRDGVLSTPPNPARSSLGVGLDGLLDVRRVSFRGTWRGLGQRRSLNFFNRPPGANGISLFTSDWGGTTPRIAGSYAVVLGDFPPATPNADLVVPVTGVGQNGPVRIIPGTAVLVARGNAATRLQAEAPVEALVTLRLVLQPDWATVSDAIGGGPMLIRDGAPVYRANEAFTASQLAPRGPRTAVGQRTDGGILFVTTDGRQPGYSVGMTNFELAQTLVRLGAVRGMALDGGGSATLAFEGTVLNRPSDGRERAVANALLLQYYGVYAPPPSTVAVSPNGDGVDETQSLSFKVVRPSETTVRLLAPDGSVAFEETTLRAPGSYAVPFPPPPPAPAPPPEGQPASPPGPEPGPLAEGRWTLTLSAADDQGLTSSATRRFSVNTTLGFLEVTPPRLVLRKAGGTTTVAWTLARAARVRVAVATPGGVPVRVVAAGRLQPGEHSAAWNGRIAGGQLAAGGRYLVTVSATNELGTVTLEHPLTVRRIAAKR